ncbi:MAG TPA: sialate O-acetylesterase, partial [Ignavibacteriaceae bacterium]|nr:sialate O-acetylesterase [Ignavibacteriaceae bacterium]
MKFIIFLVMVQLIYSRTESFIKMPSIFSDNMVLQQKSEVPFWGKAGPGNEVIITSSWGNASKTFSIKDSSWMVKIKTPEAGGPYQIIVQSGNSKIMYENVLIGEVWLCSGQSNMELHLEGEPPLIPITNSAEEIQNADNSFIRFFTVQRNISVEREFNCSGEWKECNSFTAADVSATAYFFGKKLYEELKVPIGLISSSWGGTPIQGWTSEKYLKEAGRFDSVLNKLSSSKNEIITQMNWIKNNPAIDVSKTEQKNRWQNLDFNDEECSRSNYNDNKWSSMELPVLWENTEVGNFDGAVWFRNKIQIPEKWRDNDLILELGPIDDVDRTYVNGELVGKTEEEEQWQRDRVYNIPKKIINDSILTIAVRVIDYGGGGGLYGDKSKLKIYTSENNEGISLAGEWKYLPVADYMYMKFYIYGSKEEKYFSRPKTSFEISADTTPTLLYNAMIAPLIPYKIKGAIWYQGESNTDEPKLYKKLLPLMIKNWREEWNENEFPFYFVQIAPYDYGEEIKSELLRESQFMALSTPNTGMAVTLDIGEPDNIHPADKKNVGERLALWALAKDYNKEFFYSGPLYKSMKIDSDKIILSFDYAYGGLVLKEDNSEKNFSIAGEDKKFIIADVKVEGVQLIINSPQIKNPVSVIYAWSNTAKATLFNSEGLPAT